MIKMENSAWIKYNRNGVDRRRPPVCQGANWIVEGARFLTLEQVVGVKLAGLFTGRKSEQNPPWGPWPGYSDCR